MNHTHQIINWSNTKSKIQVVMLFTHHEIADHKIIKTGRIKHLDIDEKFPGETGTAK
jgi:hypothetical protein